MAHKTQIRNKIKEVVEMAERKYGFAIPYDRMTIEWKNKGSSAASAWHQYGRYGLRISMESATLDMDEMLNDTIPHEVAHLVCFHNRSLGKNHNNGWKSVCRGLGGTGARTHSQVLTKARYKSQYLYRTDSGVECKVGPKVHKSCRLGGTRRLKSTGESFGIDHFIRHITPEEHRREHEKEVTAYRNAAGSPAAPTSHKRPTPKPASHKRPTHDEYGLPLRASIPVAPGASKKVRAMAIYTANSTDSRATIITMFMDRLDMTKAGASTYYANCKKAS